MGITVDRSRHTLHFPVVVDGQVVECIVSRDLLQRHFGAGSGPADWLIALEQNQQQIAHRAAERFRADGIAPIYMRRWQRRDRGADA